MAQDELNMVMQRLQKANSIMENLIDAAMKDEQMSSDEKEILFSINSNLEVYARKIIETLSDGKVDENEKQELKHIEQKIISDARSVANEDERISLEERDLLQQLIQAIESMKSL